MKAETIIRKDREAITRNRVRRDLQKVLNLLDAAGCLSRRTGQDDWITNKIYNLHTELLAKTP